MLFQTGRAAGSRSSRLGGRSDEFNAAAVGVNCEWLAVGSVAGDDSAVWLGDRDDEGIDG